MSLKTFPELKSFFSTFISNADLDADDSAAQAFLSATSADRQEKVISQLKQWIASPDLEELGSEANRWFGDAEEAREWLRQILGMLESSAGATNSGDTRVVKDSNGTPLSEGDSVIVIKDLKVKGGSSDLKRGTVIKKIHLVDDAEVIECRVDGSTLVLKTCFLKKS